MTDEDVENMPDLSRGRPWFAASLCVGTAADPLLTANAVIFVGRDYCWCQERHLTSVIIN